MRISFALGGWQQAVEIEPIKIAGKGSAATPRLHVPCTWIFNPTVVENAKRFYVQHALAELTIATVEDDVVRTMIPINCVTTGGQMAADRPAEFSLLPQFVERIETARKGDVVLNLDFSVYGVEAAETAVNGQRALVLLGTVAEAQF